MAGPWPSRSASTICCPSIRWDRGPYAPDQAVLVDLANRRFYFFVIEIWPQEFYYFTGLLIMAGVGLFLITAVAGRAWCGYLCPQTVWTDLFLVVERLVEGDRRARIATRQAPGAAARSAQERQACDLAGDRGGPAAPGCSISPMRRRWCRARDRPGADRRLYLDRHPDRHDLYVRRLHARTGLHLHVPLAAHPGGDARREVAERHLSTIAANRAARSRRPRAARAGQARRRLRRLQRMRRGLPDRHRHPRRPAARMHPLRPVHRCLRQRDGQDRPPDPADRL